MATYTKVYPDIVATAQSLIQDHYPDLQDAGIGFLMREEAPVQNERMIPGGVKKVGEIEREFLDYDFIVWIAEDAYTSFSERQKVACIDHYLCHCLFDNEKGKAKLNKPDIVEFSQILRRHGVWWPDGGEVREEILQMPLLQTAGNGKVEAVELPGDDVWDQLDDLDLA